MNCCVELGRRSLPTNANMKLIPILSLGLLLGGAGAMQIQLILEVRDENAIASLRDYRRVVIDVANEIVELDLKQK